MDKIIIGAYPYESFRGNEMESLVSTLSDLLRGSPA